VQVRYAPPAPTAVTLNTLTVSGTAKVGQVLTATATTTPSTAAKAYQWQRTSSAGTTTAISGATNPTYTVVAADAGYKLSVTVTANATGYAAGTATSGPTAKVEPATPSGPDPDPMTQVLDTLMRNLPLLISLIQSLFSGG
jgi:hypothetical protein